MSATAAWASKPSARSAPAWCSAALALMSATTTVAPSRASRADVAAPIPDAPPVTTAIFPATLP